MYTRYNNANEICHGLWLGDHVSSENFNFLRQKQIKLVINCTKDLQIPEEYKILSINAIRLPLTDNSITVDSKILNDNIDGTENAIHYYLSNGAHVLVHCYAGRQRSATIVAYYLMKRYFFGNYDSVFFYIQQQRPVAFTPSHRLKDYLKKRFQKKYLLSK